MLARRPDSLRVADQEYGYVKRLRLYRGEVTPEPPVSAESEETVTNDRTAALAAGAVIEPSPAYSLTPDPQTPAQAPI